MAYLRSGMWLKVSKVDTAARIVPYRSSFSRSCCNSSSARKAQLFGLIPHNTEHLLGLVDADDIIARLGQHQGQLPGSAAQIGQDAVPDAVGIQLLPDVP